MREGSFIIAEHGDLIGKLPGNLYLSLSYNKAQFLKVNSEKPGRPNLFL